jgi:hypothetical protein
VFCARLAENQRAEAAWLFVIGAFPRLITRALSRTRSGLLLSCLALTPPEAVDTSPLDVYFHNVLLAGGG